MAQRSSTATRSRRSSSTALRRKPAPRRGVTRRSQSGRGRKSKPRFGPAFFTVLAITGICALAFLGLVASAMAGT